MKRIASLVASAVFLLTTSIAAQPQDAPPAAAPAPAPAEKADEEIIVTGSRIKRQDVIANSPVSSIGTEELELTATVNVEDVIREMPQACKYVPASSKFKIYIIDEVHMLSTAAYNALLKTLEEPPTHVKFMFATTDPEKVLPTILSRCQRFDLRRIPTSLIVKHLEHIPKLEKVKVEEAALFAIARGAEGGMRDAESALAQLISFCGNQIEEADVLSMFGLTAQGQILDLSRAVLAGEIATALHPLNDLAQKGKDLGGKRRARRWR